MNKNFVQLIVVARLFWISSCNTLNFTQFLPQVDITKHYSIASKCAAIHFGCVGIFFASSQISRDSLVLREQKARSEFLQFAYIDPVVNLLERLKNYTNLNGLISIAVGDNFEELPRGLAISKSRPIGSKTLGLLPLNRKRHWKLFDDPYSFEDKPIRSAIFRGVNTGIKRHTLVKRFCNDSRVDVGFTLCLDEYPPKCSPGMHKGFVRRSKLVEHQFLISIEGNDKASGLQWMLSTNSVVMMPIPSVESWLLESRLIPWHHFIPIDVSGADLIEKLSWGLSHPEECKNITASASKFVRGHPLFSDPNFDLGLQLNVVKWFATHVG